MLLEATNIAAELRLEEVTNESNRYITCVTLPDKRTVAINAGICEACREHFQDLFTRDTGVRSAQFNAHLPGK